MKQRINFAVTHLWRALVLGSLVIALIAGLLLVRLGSEPHHFTAAEIAARHASHSLHVIFNNPINAPFTLLQHFLVAAHPHSIFLSRLPAALYGGLTLIILYAILRFWQGRFVATLGTALLATSSWFLHIAQTGTPGVLLFGTLALIGCALLLKHTLRRGPAFFLSIFVAASLLYVPGMAWLIIFGLIWQYKSILRNLKHVNRKFIIVGGILFLVLIAPLIRACALQPSLILNVFGLPSSVPAPIKLLHNAANIPLQLFIHIPANNPLIWVGQLPVLDVFSDAMFALGLHLTWKHRELDRNRLIAASGLGAIILIILGGAVDLTIMVPLVYVVITGGIGYVADRWLSVFPGNPLARTAGMTLLVIAVLVSMNFQLQRYFVALPYVLTQQQPTIQQQSQVSATIKQ